MNKVIELSKGNPGAMTCLMGLNNEQSSNIISIVEKNNIVGTDIYIIWSDLCGKDNAKMEHLCLNCPEDILKDAANRQDYSGRKLVEPYIMK